MRLEGPHRGHDDGAVRPQARVAALDVAELLEAAVGAEAALGDEVPVAHQAEGDLVGDDGAVAVGDVGEGTGVDQDRRVLQGLHQVGHHGVLEQDRHRPGRAQVLGGHRPPGAVEGGDDPPQPGAQILQVPGQRQDGHHLGGGGDVEAAAPAHALAALADDDLAQGAVPEVDDPLPHDPVRVDVEPLQAAPAQAPVAQPLLVVEPRVQGGGEQVVGRGDGVDVAGQVQVHLVHGDDLRPASAGGASLDAEGRPHGGLADRGDRGVAEGVEGLTEAEGGRRLALAVPGWGHGGDDDVLPLPAAAPPVHGIEVDLGLVAAVQVDVAVRQPQSRGDAGGRLGGRRTGDVEIAHNGLPGRPGEYRSASEGPANPPGSRRVRCAGRPASLSFSRNHGGSAPFTHGICA